MADGGEYAETQENESLKGSPEEEECQEFSEKV